MREWRKEDGERGQGKGKTWKQVSVLSGHGGDGQLVVWMARGGGGFVKGVRPRHLWLPR